MIGGSGMQKESKFALFNYNQCDTDLIEGLSNYLDENAHIAFEFFNIQHNVDEKVKINIVPTKKEFNYLYIKNRNLPLDYHVPDWLVGTSIFNKRQIIYLSLHDYKSTSNPMKDEPFDNAFDYYKKTILHEFVHFVYGLYREKNNKGNTIRCFGEGIACYLSGQRDGKNIKFKASCEKLLSGGASYDQYYLVTKYLVENYDKNFVLQMLSNENLASDFLKNELYDKVSQFYNKQIF